MDMSLPLTTTIPPPPGTLDAEEGLLSVSLSVPESVTDIRSFDIELTLENTSDVDYDVVKDPSGPLFDELPINAWAWERETNGSDSTTRQPVFIGASVNWDLDSYLEETLNDDPANYQSPHATTIALRKGERKTVSFQVGYADDFMISGPGTYKVKLRRDSMWIIVAGNVKRAKISAETHKVNISGKLAGQMFKKQRPKGASIA